MKKELVEVNDPNAYYGVSLKFKDGSDAISCDFCGEYFTDKGLRIHFGKVHAKEDRKG